jgi:hypothetical protein
MLLTDPRLRFARDLIGHWLDIRGGALVPADEDLDPREVVRSLDSIAIADLTQPRQLVFALAGAGVRRRFGRDIRRVNWVDLVPPLLGEAGQRALDRVRRVPCGYYHSFSVARDGAPAVTAETVVLPLRHRPAAVPVAVIGMTRELDGSAGSAPAGWLHPLARVERYRYELVDIGAGGARGD